MGGGKPWRKQVSGNSKFSEWNLVFWGNEKKINPVALKSALQDFESTTLAAVPGLLGKLHYIAWLHDEQGNYSHWGLERTHGAGPAQRAIRMAHAVLLTHILRAPLRALEEDLQYSTRSGEVTAEQFLLSLIRRLPYAIPEKSGEPSARHLRAVLHALSLLAESPVRPSRPGASPPPRPGR
jgi:hypothetical protein